MTFQRMSPGYLIQEKDTPKKTKLNKKIVTVRAYGDKMLLVNSRARSPLLWDQKFYVITIDRSTILLVEEFTCYLAGFSNGSRDRTQ